MTDDIDSIRNRLRVSRENMLKKYVGKTPPEAALQAMADAMEVDVETIKRIMKMENGK